MNFVGLGWGIAGQSGTGKGADPGQVFQGVPSDPVGCLWTVGIGSIEKAPTKKRIIGATSKIHTKFPWRWRDSKKRSRSPAPSQPAQPARQQAIQGASAVGRAILYNTWTLHRYCPSLGRHVLHMGFLIHGCRLGKIRFSPGTPSMY